MNFTTLPNWLAILIVLIVIIALIVIVSLFAIVMRTYLNNGYVNIWGLEISKDKSCKTNKLIEIENNAKNKIQSQYSWSDIEIGVKDLRQQILNSNYMPTLLVGIGRGGAIMSALLSGNLSNERHIPFIALERKYENKNGMRDAYLFDDVSFTQDLDRVLLVAGDIVTGETAQVFTDFLIQQGTKEIKFLAYVMVSSTNKKPDYFYSKSDSTDFKFPWMFSNEYKRDSRIK
jgi:probable phosphoglycerate mutase